MRVAHYAMGEALAISEGIDRDRAVDESGNQLAVFGRRGARPFNKADMERLYLRDGKVFTVTNEPVGQPAETKSSSVIGALRRAYDDLVASAFGQKSPREP